MGNISSKFYFTGGATHIRPDTNHNTAEHQPSAQAQAAIVSGPQAAPRPHRHASRGTWRKLFDRIPAQGSGKKARAEIVPAEFSGNAQDVRSSAKKFPEESWRHRNGDPRTLAYLFNVRTPALALALVADIKTMTDLLDTKASKQQVSEANKQFNSIYGWVFGKTKFAEKKTAAYMRAFSLELESRISLEPARNSQPVERAAMPLTDMAEAAQPTLAELETIQRQFRFTESLTQVPIQTEQPVVYTETAPEPVNPRNQYVGTSVQQSTSTPQPLRNRARAAIESSPLGQDLMEAASHLSELGRNLKRKAMPQSSSSETGPVWKKYGTLIGNAGGGDCLFHALNGADLSLEEILVCRENIANIKRNDSDTTRVMSFNAHQLAAGLSQTPEYRSSASAMMNGRHEIPNNVYADFQAIPGTYAGEDELSQWTALEENRGKTVVVIDEDGTYAMFKNRERTPIPADQLDQHVGAADIVLYKTALHWAQIRKPAK